MRAFSHLNNTNSTFKVPHGLSLPVVGMGSWILCKFPREIRNLNKQIEYPWLGCSLVAEGGACGWEVGGILGLVLGLFGRRDILLGD